MAVVYLACLLGASGCMLLLDARFRLFFWRDWRAAAVVTVGGVLFLLAWDLVGIMTGVFEMGASAGMTGILIAHELPIEEPVFLAFLVLCTMVIFTGAVRLLERRAARRGAAAEGR
ncbi:lycopene cyclase domain-containing protein [Leucobacter chromiiresistens]|uniref:C50 carotenoid epsilon cyclase n=1 Tax=Leucobacter chromiiresistens TaxID=1079994 RepID=A0A147ENQ9_9MICO|nr:lycopene cyclase domain-containing protein [Leucobacter chromiiresistens]KTR86167.1 C50 carotenoid epsilon cyclase [Leucobacter chromiiresistens]